MKRERIESNPKIMMGKPVIRSTRVTVEHILRELAAGMSIDEIVDERPRLTRADVYAAQAFAADYVRDWATVYD